MPWINLDHSEWKKEAFCLPEEVYFYRHQWLSHASGGELALYWVEGKATLNSVTQAAFIYK